MPGIFDNVHFHISRTLRDSPPPPSAPPLDDTWGVAASYGPQPGYLAAPTVLPALHTERRSVTTDGFMSAEKRAINAMAAQGFSYVSKRREFPLEVLIFERQVRGFNMGAQACTMAASFGSEKRRAANEREAQGWCFTHITKNFPNDILHFERQDIRPA